MKSKTLEIKMFTISFVSPDGVDCWFLGVIVVGNWFHARRAAMQKALSSILKRQRH